MRTEPLISPSHTLSLPPRSLFATFFLTCVGGLLRRVARWGGCVFCPACARAPCVLSSLSTAVVRRLPLASRVVAPTPHSTAFGPASATFHPQARWRGLFASAPLLICPPPAVSSCPSCSCHLLRLTRQSSGTPEKPLFSGQSTSRGAPYFHVRP